MARSRQLQEALQLFAEMQDEGIKPDSITYNALMKACISSGTLDKAMQLFKEMQQRGVKPTVVTFNTLLQGHNADLRAVQQLFTAMKERGIAPRTVTYNTLITVYSDSVQLDAAWQMYDEMTASGVSLIDQTGAVITLCGQARESARALQLFNEMVNSAIQPTAIVCNSLITACGNGGNWQKAVDNFTKMKQKSIQSEAILYVNAITACSDNNSITLHGKCMLSC
jgi:pentatricopeptide repeat domain-containing protein 1